MDFLTFKSFISTEVLILLYYFGAILLPLGTWLLVMQLIHKYQLLHTPDNKGEKEIWKHLNNKQKTKLIVFVTSLFIFTELFWRMLFEFLIAYMQIRDAVLQAQIY